MHVIESFVIQKGAGHLPLGWSQLLREFKKLLQTGLPTELKKVTQVAPRADLDNKANLLTYKYCGVHTWLVPRNTLELKESNHACVYRPVPCTVPQALPELRCRARATEIKRTLARLQIIPVMMKHTPLHLLDHCRRWTWTAWPRRQHYPSTYTGAI